MGGFRLIPGTAGGMNLGRSVTANPDMQGFVRLAMLMKQEKLQEEDRKRNEAMQSFMMGLNMAKQGMPIDLKKMNSAARIAGIPLGSDGVEQPTTSSTIPGGPLPISAQKLAMLGSAMQSQGAQAAGNVSPQEAKKYPAGGVTPVGSGTDTLTQLQQAAKAQYGVYAPLYEQHLAQEELANIKMHHAMMIDQLQQEAAGGSASAAFRLAELSKQNLTVPQIKAILAGSNSPKAASTALGLLLGSESSADKAKRETTIFQSVMKANPDTNPDIAHAIANSLVNNQPISPRVEKEMQREDMYRRYSTAFDKYSKEFSPQVAESLAAAYAMRVPLNEALPKNAMSFPELKAAATVTTANAAAMKAQAAQTQAGAAMLKQRIDAAKNTPNQLAIANDLKIIDEYSKAKKLGLTVPEGNVQNALNDLGLRTGMQPGEVSHLWGLYHTMGLVPKGMDVSEYAGTPQPGAQGETSVPLPFHFTSKGAFTGQPGLPPGVTTFEDFLNWMAAHPAFTKSAQGKSFAQE